MKLSAKVDGSFSAAMAAAKVIKTNAAVKGLTSGGSQLKNVLRDDVSSAGLGDRLARTWQLKVYRNNGRNPAALVYSKAPKIISAYARGATIVATGGRRLLALPTDNVPKKRQGQSLTPREVESRFGRKLRFVLANRAQAAAAGGNNAFGFLMLDGVTASKSNGRLRAASARALEGAGRANQVKSVLMFTLERSVTVRQRIDLAARASEAATNTSLLIEREMA